jgi:hypothetical protein
LPGAWPAAAGSRGRCWTGGCCGCCGCCGGVGGFAGVVAGFGAATGAGVPLTTDPGPR